MVTKRQYDSLKKDIIRQIDLESSCQCNNKSYEDKFIFATIITKYKEPRWSPWTGYITEKTETIWECPKCGKKYGDPVVAMA